MDKLRDINSEKKEIRHNILSMILPISTENVLQMAAGTVTMAFVGRLSPLAVGAVGIGNILFRIVWSWFKGLGIGASAYVAHNYGSNENHKNILMIRQGLILVIAASMLLQQGLFWFADSLVKMFTSHSELLESAATFLKITSWSIPFASIILFASGILQGKGDAKTPMISTVILNLLNIVFSFLLIFGMFGFPELGLKGAAYALNIGHFAASLFSLYTLYAYVKKTIYDLDLYDKISRSREFNSLIRYGLPASLEISFWQISAGVIAKGILTYGETEYAAYQLGLQAESISYMPAAGISIAAAAFIGQALGSGNHELGRMYYVELKKITLLIAMATGGMLIFFPAMIMRVLTDNLEVVKIGSIYLFTMGFMQIPQNLTLMLNGVFRGAGCTYFPMINAGIGIWIIRVPLVLFVSYVVKGELLMVWLSLALDLTIRFLIAYMVFKREKIFREDEYKYKTNI